MATIVGFRRGDVLVKRSAPPEEEDPEVVWRRVIRRRMHWANMLFGSWYFVTPRQLSEDHKFHRSI